MLRNAVRRLFPARETEIPMLPSVQAYHLWAATYPPHAHNPLMMAEERATLSLMPPLTEGIVLDLASGSGRYGLIARERGARRVIAVDNSANMLAINLIPARALATCEAIPLASASFDGVICALALGHLERLAPSLREIARVLKPGGWALISDFHPFMALTGAQRTFTAPDGMVYAVEHYAHLYSDMHLVAGGVGLRVDAVVEPGLDAERGLNPPVAIVYRLMKTAGPS